MDLHKFGTGGSTKRCNHLHQILVQLLKGFQFCRVNETPLTKDVTVNNLNTVMGFSWSLSSVAKRYILQQKCLKKWIGSAVLRKRRYLHRPGCHSGQSQTLRQYHVNSQSHYMCYQWLKHLYHQVDRLCIIPIILLFLWALDFLSLFLVWLLINSAWVIAGWQHGIGKVLRINTA